MSLLPKQLVNPNVQLDDPRWPLDRYIKSVQQTSIFWMLDLDHMLNKVVDHQDQSYRGKKNADPRKLQRNEHDKAKSKKQHSEVGMVPTLAIHL